MSEVADGALERLFELAIVMSEAMERGLTERGLTRARGEVLWRLHHEGPMTQRALSQALHCSPRNVTWLADALEGDGFITRGPHPTDRRATLISLTERGAAAAAAAHTDYQQASARLFAGVPEADMKAFVAVLDLVLDRLRSGGMEDGGRRADGTTRRPEGRPAATRGSRPSMPDRPRSR